MTGPAIVKILAPTPVTQPSALNSMAGLTTELANPVIGTSVPAPALAASFWYHPGSVNSADRKISAMLVSVPASVLSYQIRKSWRSPSPTVQIAPPTQNAHTQSRTTGEGGEARPIISSYCLGFSFTLHSSFWGIVCAQPP